MSYYIYRITNLINNKIYIGQSIDAINRWKDHIYDAKRQVGKTIKKKCAIHHALNKYGIENFNWEIINIFETLDEVNIAETNYIFTHNSLSPNGYNLNMGGNNRSPSQETRDKIGETLKTTGSFVGKKGALHPNFGTKHSEERKANQSKKLSGDKSSAKKITSEIAKQIYLDFLNDEKLTISDLEEKYILKRVAIYNILHKKCWKEILKDLPIIDIIARSRNKKESKAPKLVEANVIDIKIKYKSGNYSYNELSIIYKVSRSTIYNICQGNIWKNIKV